MNKQWHDSLSSTMHDCFQGQSLEKKQMISFIKSFHERKSFSLTALSDNNSKLDAKHFVINDEIKKNEDDNNSKKWLRKKIVSNERVSERKSFKGSHSNEFIASFNEYYEKIQTKLDCSHQSYEFDVLIDNPMARHILDTKIKKSRKREKKSTGFGQYLSDSLRKRIQEKNHNNTFFSMNFCKKIVNKKHTTLEKLLLKKINPTKLDDTGNSLLKQSKSKLTQKLEDSHILKNNDENAKLGFLDNEEDSSIMTIKKSTQFPRK